MPREITPILALGTSFLHGNFRFVPGIFLGFLEAILLLLGPLLREIYIKVNSQLKTISL